MQYALDYSGTRFLSTENQNHSMSWGIPSLTSHEEQTTTSVCKTVSDYKGCVSCVCPTMLYEEERPFIYL